jgi:hypothetical protein
VILSPSLWLACLTAAWGLVTMLSGFTQNFGGAFAARFCLGICEVSLGHCWPVECNLTILGRLLPRGHDDRLYVVPPQRNPEARGSLLRHWYPLRLLQ